MTTRRSAGGRGATGSIRRRTAARASAVLALVALGLGAAAPASAGTESNWWYDPYGVPAAQAAGITGKGVTIAVIDGQINSSLPVFQGTGLSVKGSLCPDQHVPADTTDANANSVHGSDVTALIIGTGEGPGAVKGIAPDARVLFYGDADAEGGLGHCNGSVGNRAMTSYGMGITAAIAAGARIISISQGSEDSALDVPAVSEAIAKGVIIVAAQPNTQADAATRFPADANGVVGVNRFDRNGDLVPDGSWTSTTVVAPGVDLPSQAVSTTQWGEGGSVSGSSLATPLVAGILADVMQKYPKATGNQVIQSLIRNTSLEKHPLEHQDNGLGYGRVSLTHLLAVDPTTYPDVNPLLDKKDGLGIPTAADIAAAEKALATTSASPAPSASRSADPSPAAGVPWWAILLVVGVIVLLVVVALIVTLVVRSTRKRNGVPQ